MELNTQVRDRIKDESYFERFIKEEADSILDFQNSLLANEIEEDAVEQVNIVISQAKLHILVARYSMGVSANLLVDEYLEAAYTLLKTWESDSGYVEMLWMLSLSLLLGQSQMLVPFAQVVDRDKLKDFILDRLIATNNSDRIMTQRLEWPSAYQLLKEAIKTNRTDAAPIMKKYLEQWYKAHNDCSWHDSHKASHNIYFGYWSFEAAAITAIMNIDDSSYRDNPYYPKDLVDYYRAQQ